MVKRAHGIASYREMFLDQKAQHKSYKKKKKRLNVNGMKSG
jgi:hypothetical protein